MNIKSLNRIQIDEAFKILIDKDRQQYLYFRAPSSKTFGRVIDYEWVVDAERKNSLTNLEFYYIEHEEEK